MSTAAMPQTIRRYDRIFFPVMTALILAAVFIGFSRTYYMAGLAKAPLPNVLIHIHGAIFTSWLLMLTVQTGLVTAHRVDLHRKLGLVGFGLACLMIVVGTLAATDSLRRGFTVHGLDSQTFYIVPITDIFLFAILVFCSWRARSKPASHKRLILLATLAILDAAIARWPYAYIRMGTHWAADLTLYVFLLLLAGYDLATTRRIHRSTLWGSLLLIVVQQVRIPIGLSGPWHSFASHVLALAIMVHGKL